MPLIQGKSQKSFDKNVETEMKAHPDQRAKNLAIAYAVKRKAQQKKMARGGLLPHEGRQEIPSVSEGVPASSKKEQMREAKYSHLAKGGTVPAEDHAREYDKSVFEEGDEELHSLHPGHGDEPPTSSLDHERLSGRAYGHDVIEEPLEQETGKHYLPDPEDLPSHMMARGGMFEPDHVVVAIRHKKMAEGGYLKPEYDYLAENDSYPDPNVREYDTLTADRHLDDEASLERDRSSEEYEPRHLAMGGYDEGGQVGDPDKLASAQDSMRKAFKFADGGDIEETTDKDKLHSISQGMQGQKSIWDKAKDLVSHQAQAAEPAPSPSSYAEGGDVERQKKHKKIREIMESILK